jgi:hypothetical protein
VHEKPMAMTLYLNILPSSGSFVAVNKYNCNTAVAVNSSTFGDISMRYPPHSSCT